eukprot:Rhum_TRINITY_DN10919_c0_g1::Rhum_TRINITY_DN10919_c0_g1_i1::g.41331::m.41331
MAGNFISGVLLFLVFCVTPVVSSVKCSAYNCTVGFKYKPAHDSIECGVDISDCDDHTCCDPALHCDSYHCGTGYADKHEKDAIECHATCDDHTCCDAAGGGHDPHEGTHAPGAHGTEHALNGTCTCPDSAVRSGPLDEISCSFNAAELTCEIQSLCHEHPHHDPPYVIFFIFVSFVLGALVRYFFQSPPLNKLPYTIVVFVVGVAIGIIARAADHDLDKFISISEINPHLIFFIFLPILIFESAFSLQWHTLKKTLPYCLMLAGPGILLATFLTAALAKLFFTTSGVGTYEWSWITCILYGAIVSATDPVAVVALLKEIGAPESISVLIEGESLLNDGTAIVLFNLLVSAVPTGEYDFNIHSLGTFCWIAFGGPVVGLVAGIIGEWCLSKVFNDALIEITITVCAAYLTFFVAEGFLHVSGVLALVVLGVWLSHHRQAISPEVEHTLHEFWETTVFLTNTLIFILVGLVASSRQFHNMTHLDIVYTFAAYIIITVVRALLIAMVYPTGPYLSKISGWQLGKKESVLVWWGGLRGAVGLALTLLVDGDTAIHCAQGDVGSQFLIHIIGIVGLTLVVNGLSSRIVVAHLQLAKVPLAQMRLLERCFDKMVESQHDCIRELKINHVLSDVNWQHVNRHTHEGMHNPFHPTESDEEGDDSSPEEEARMAYLKLLRSSVWEQYEHGFISTSTIPRVLKFIDTAKDTHGQLISADLLNKYWEESFMASKVGGLALSLPVCGNQMSKLSTKWKEDRWAAGFDVANCLISAHEDVLEGIDSLVSDCKEANKIKVHCKSLRAGCFGHVHDLATERVQIAVAIQTKHAARRVLNRARSTVHQMVRRGQLDESDASGLRKIVEKRMNWLMKTSSQMSPADQEEVLQDEVRWMHRVEFACQQEFKMNGRVYLPRKRNRIITRENVSAGFYIIISGVARAVLPRTRKTVLFGCGDCIGVSNVLCSSPAMPEVYADTDMKLVWYTADIVRSLMAKYPLLVQELWKAASVEGALTVLHSQRPYCDLAPLELVKFCETGEMISGDGRFAQTGRSSVLPAGMHHMLINGSVVIDRQTFEGLQRLEINDDQVRVMLGVDAQILSINDPTSKQSAARARWAKVRSKIQLVRRGPKLRGLRVAMQREFGDEGAVMAPDSPLYPSRVRRGSTAKQNSGNASEYRFEEPLLNDIWQEMTVTPHRVDNVTT